MKILDIYYDDFCPNCTRFINVISKLDWLNLIKIKKLRNILDINNAKGIDENLAEKQMASFDGNWNYGYITLFKIFSRIPVFWIFIPLFWLLKISTHGQYFYLQLAVNRKIIPLHCNGDSCKIPKR